MIPRWTSRKRRKQFLVWSPYVILILGLGLTLTGANDSVVVVGDAEETPSTTAKKVEILTNIFEKCERQKERP